MPIIMVMITTITTKLPVHVRTHKETFDRNQRIKAMHRKTTDARNRVNQITYQSMQSTGALVLESSDDTAVTETAAVVAALYELRSPPATRSREICEPIPLPPAFALPQVMALDSAPYSRVHTSTTGEVPPAWIEKSVWKDKGKHKQTADG